MPRAKAKACIMRGYTAVVSRTMKARYFTLLGAIGVLIVSVYFMVQIPGSFIPPEDVSRISISVELPPGSTLADTDRTTQAMRAQIAEVEGVDAVFVLGGSSPTGDRDIRRASVTVVLGRLDHSLLRRLSEISQRLPLVGLMVPDVPSTGRMRPQNEIEAEMFERLADIPDVRAYKLNDRGERDISFSILSADEADLNTAVAALEQALRGDPLLANVSASRRAAAPRSADHVRARARRRDWASPRRRSRKPCGWRPSAMSMRRWPRCRSTNG